MSAYSVNISFQKELLKQIDDIAAREARSRSGPISEAARMYIQRINRWKNIFDYGEAVAAAKGLKEENILKTIKTIRRKKS